MYLIPWIGFLEMAIWWQGQGLGRCAMLLMLQCFPNPRIGGVSVSANGYCS